VLQRWLAWHAVSNTLTPADNYSGYRWRFSSSATAAQSAGWGSGGGWGPIGQWGGNPVVPNIPKTPQKKKKRKARLRRIREEADAAYAAAVQAEQGRVEEEPNGDSYVWYISTCTKS
jgi:hypothetical protein